MNHILSWTHPALSVRNAKSGGRGVFVTSTLKEGETVIMYGGTVMTLEEEASLPDTCADFAHQIDDNLVIGAKDPSELGLSDLVNHSCSPNCGFKGQIRLVAMRDIKQGEEVTFDYAMVLYAGSKEHDYKLQCKCPSPECRKVITTDDWKLPSLRDAYRGYFQEFLESKISLEKKSVAC
jgi:uncharacterized protein